MSRSTVDRLRAGSSADGPAAYTPICSISCTHVVFKRAPVDRQLARRGSNQRCWTPMESDSLDQGRMGLRRLFEKGRRPPMWTSCGSVCTDMAPSAEHVVQYCGQTASME